MANNLVVHCKKAKYDVYIGRPCKWGNPFSHKDGTLAKYKVDTREQAIEQFRAWVLQQPELMACVHELAGKVLGCWCAPQSCHGEVLSSIAEMTAFHLEHDLETEEL